MPLPSTPQHSETWRLADSSSRSRTSHLETSLCPTGDVAERHHKGIVSHPARLDGTRLAARAARNGGRWSTTRVYIVTQSQARLWHGGAPGRRANDLLLPPIESGLTFTRRDISVEEGLSHIAQRDDRVYVTTDRTLARAWAGLWTPDGRTYPGGTLYRVDATDLEPDEDLLSLHGLSYQVPHATVIAVYDAHVPHDRVRQLAVLQRVLEQHERMKRTASANESANGTD